MRTHTQGRERESGRSGPGAPTLAGLYAMQGHFGHARALLAESHAAFEDLGLTLSFAVSHTAAGTVELLAGDVVAAEQSLRRG